MPETTPNSPESPEREAPPAQEDPRDAFRSMMERMFGNMEDDRSRRRRGSRRRQPQQEEDDLNIDCLLKNRPNTTFDDIAGNEEAVEEMKEIVEAVEDPDSYTMFGAKLPKGILMTGVPGCGKTYMTGALATALDAPFYHVQVSNVTSMWFGESEKNLQKIFTHAKKYCRGEIDINSETGECSEFDPERFAEERAAELTEADDSEEEVSNRRMSAVREQIREEIEARQNGITGRHAIIFFDEIDALGASRDNTPFQGGVSNRIVSVLLENMDGLESGDNIIVVASTNRPGAVDPALRRAGRFDRIIKVKKPNQAARNGIFDIHFRKAEEKADREFVRVNSAELAMKTKRLVGADIAEIVRKACQEQAKKYRKAESEEEKEALSILDQDTVLAVIKEYRTNLRKKDPDAKGSMGFKPASAPEEDESEELCVEEELE